jgi:nitrous oxidase accessory protein NosD
MGLVAALATAVLVAPVAAATPPGLYVAKHHSSDSNPCSTSQPCLTIGHAISVAAAGATIHVARGTYAEQVSITQKVTLISDHAIIDATGQHGGIQPLAGMGVVGYGLLVFGPGASGSVVKGFTVQHAIGEGILVAGTSKVLIESNVVRLNDAGFNTTMTLECQAQGNIPGDCGEGVHFLSVTWSRLVNNVVENNIGGILVTDEVGPSAHNVISGNVSKNNLQDCGITLPSHNALAMADKGWRVRQPRHQQRLRRQRRRGRRNVRPVPWDGLLQQPGHPQHAPQQWRGRGGHPRPCTGPERFGQRDHE